MDYTDRTLVRLADPATRGALFDQDSLAHLLGAAYDLEGANLQGPYQPLFDELHIGVPAGGFGTFEGAWNPVGSVDRTEARFRFSGPGVGGAVRVDALWRGAIAARVQPATAPITDVSIAWPQLAGLDAEIVAALGALPNDPAVLEQERRTRLLARIQASLGQPASFTAAVLERWLAGAGATSVAELLARTPGLDSAGAVQVTFAPVAAPPATPQAVRFAAALLIRDAGFSLAQLIADSKLVRQQLEPMGVERPREATLRLRHALVVAWIVPAAVFDDADWPGGDGAPDAAAARQQRRLAAGAWLAREGIGLVVTA